LSFFRLLNLGSLGIAGTPALAKPPRVAVIQATSARSAHLSDFNCSFPPMSRHPDLGFHGGARMRSNGRIAAIQENNLRRENSLFRLQISLFFKEFSLFPFLGNFARNRCGTSLTSRLYAGKSLVSLYFSLLTGNSEWRPVRI
jgi:hypothetical protein